MNDKQQENGTLSGPLILTLPASNFVAIVRPDWLTGIEQTAVRARMHGWKLGPATDGPSKDWARNEFESGDPDLATCLENYGSLLRKSGRGMEARALECRARGIRAAHNWKCCLAVFSR
jgi:hypothetical protein